ncbi:LacI family DNA-binding transcriptional regulator [Microbispora sp. H10949]|uniref:LacI family DNA-binding transcriptional regulator n=1 Tax=Microbispora sp. H10949 TaxID=2729111 RepID=UPI0016036729|nr:substrate-binding domain-containing protein [Microbispora sp. H10949]
MSAGTPVGLVLARPPRLLGAEPFFLEFIAGIEELLAEHDRSVLLHVVNTHEAEIAAYRRWADNRMVDAVVLVNRTVEDVRPAVLREIGLPAVVAGEPEGDTPAVRTDDVGAVREAVAHLSRLGHRRIARVSGPTALIHTRIRTRALLDSMRSASVEPVMLEGDYSEESGAKLTAKLLERPDPPTAIIYDNDLMGVAGLAAAKELGCDVPRDLSLIAWDDSSMCRLASPPLTTMSLDVHLFGQLVAASLLELVEGGPVTERRCPTATLIPRGTTAPASAG